MYYLRAEGDFFWIYFLVGLVLVGILAVLSCAFGTCLFMFGSAVALKFVEEALKNVDNLPEMMKSKAN